MKNKTIILEKVRATEKVVRQIETENMVSFLTDRAISKDEIKKEVESLFNVKVKGVRTLNSKNKKVAYVTLKKDYSAADVATKLGVL